MYEIIPGNNLQTYYIKLYFFETVENVLINVNIIGNEDFPIKMYNLSNSAVTSFEIKFYGYYSPQERINAI